METFRRNFTEASYLPKLVGVLFGHLDVYEFVPNMVNLGILHKTIQNAVQPHLPNVKSYG